MQIQKQFATDSSWVIAMKIFKNDGLRGFFRGCVPPLWGSMCYRGIMMSGYEYFFTLIDQYPHNLKNTHKDMSDNSFNHKLSTFLLVGIDGISAHVNLKEELAFGIRPMVLLSSMFAAVARSSVESPIEYAKLMGQIGQKWKIRDIYRGFGFQVIRTTALIVPIFVMIDVARRKTTLMVGNPIL